MSTFLDYDPRARWTGHVWPHGLDGGAGTGDSQVDSVATWLGALATIATVVLALWLAARERRRSEAERHAQARLITVEVDYSSYEQPNHYEYAMALVKIHNQSQQPVHWPEVEEIVGAQPSVRWGPAVSAEGGEPFYSPPEVLKPGTFDSVPFEHVDDDGRIVDPAEADDALTAHWERDSAGKLHILTKITAAGQDQGSGRRRQCDDHVHRHVQAAVAAHRTERTGPGWPSQCSNPMVGSTGGAVRC
jgi:hypothetical protein